MKTIKLCIAQLLFFYLVFNGSNELYSQYDCPGGEPCCKVQFCSCCGDYNNFIIYYVNGDSVAGSFTTGSHGCTEPGVFSANAGVSYYIMNLDGCEMPTVYFTGCFCPLDSGVQTIILPCCDGDSKLNSHNHKPNNPLDYKLDQNYPNPFNPKTSIKYYIPKESKVKVIVYDLTGKLISTLVDGIVAQGNHEVIWDASFYASGIYFYKLETGSFSDEKKMVLVK